MKSNQWDVRRVRARSRYQRVQARGKRDCFAMTIAQIEKKQAMANIVFDTAKAIRKLLDDARAAYGAEAWDDDCKQGEIGREPSSQPNAQNVSGSGGKGEAKLPVTAEIYRHLSRRREPPLATFSADFLRRPQQGSNLRPWL
jgi:hypothetical protein